MLKNILTFLPDILFHGIMQYILLGFRFVVLYGLDAILLKT